MDEHLDVRMPLEDRSGRSRVIEMDVRQEDLPDVLKADCLAFERRLERLQGRRRARIDQRDARRPVKDSGGNQLTAAEELQIDVVEAGSKD
jgi:hypothetical protein